LGAIQEVSIACKRAPTYNPPTQLERDLE
jgi:hypothetical protein